MSLKLYAINLSAVKMNDPELDGHPNVSMSVGIMLTEDSDDIERSGLEEAKRIFPESQGWEDHQVAYVEIEKETYFGPYTLTWEVNGKSD